MRSIIFEKISMSHRETWIAALGGHNFPVFAPPGHAIIPLPTKSIPLDLTPLVHETGAVREIRTCKFLSSMKRSGGINFCPRETGGYRPKAPYKVCIEEAQLQAAISEGLVFFENRFSELVFGVGRWDYQKNWWDGRIPMDYLTIKHK